MCNTEFEGRPSDRANCSPACALKSRTLKRRKYSDETIQQILDLRKQGITRKEIVSRLGVNIQIVKETIIKFNAQLPPEIAKQNAQNALSAKYGSKQAHTAHMRAKGLTSEVITRRSASCSIRNKERAINDGKTATERYKEKYPDRVLKSYNLYNKRYPEYRAYMSACRRAYKLQRMPKWLTRAHIDEIETIYKKCPKGYHVDHVVPLKGKDVSGLHVPWNLQILTAKDNLKKKNKF